MNDPLTHSDADTTFLWLSGNGIESINGIQNFAYLDTLNISDNHVTDLSPLKGLPQDKVWPWMNKFIELNISNNGITDPAALNLDSLTNLTDLATLNMSGNKMGNITALQAVTVFPSLTSLDLSSNQISDMTPITQRLSQLTKLSTLDISKQIIRLPDLTLNPGQPMSLGPGTVNSGNPPATPALLAAQDPAKPLAPATNGSYDAPGAKAVWSTTLPGEHTYSFAHSGALTVAGKSYAFSGTFIQDVTGSIVTFDPANGQPTFTRPVAANTAVARPPDPVRADWHFAGWFQAGASSPWNFSQPVLTSMTLTARWSQFRTLPQSGAIPLEHLGGGALLMVSLVSAGAYGAYLLVRKRPLSAPSSRLAGRRSSQRRH
ncbi:hypothetical protein KIM372_13630 [Bombiscardovia nodaiensis]|uniref:Uncharacterized protein n=1 Tax=Bombiscardovia nodaiensis TaxID=2932181 RepID=A0ABM8B9G7_9BIFI|nr:hypothetical protein KIM372_13630 [Bombiscardovia nodaiensis]